MLSELKKVNETFISVMKRQNGVLGSWYFGSISHEMSDDYSDIDIVFLIEDNTFEDIGRNLTKLIAPAVDKIILCWPEEFNNDRIKNYDYLLLSNGQLFQYDVFLINQNYTNDFMCRMHYTDLQEQNVIFDIQGNVSALLKNAPHGSRWSGDIKRLLETYWLHIQMSAKYFLRKDFFKLENILRILMDTHTSLLLSEYDIINWGGTANKLHFIPAEKQKHLMKYGCTENFNNVRNNLLQSMLWFEEDIREIAPPEYLQESEEIGKVIKKYWRKNTENL